MEIDEELAHENSVGTNFNGYSNDHLTASYTVHQVTSYFLTSVKDIIFFS